MRAINSVSEHPFVGNGTSFLEENADYNHMHESLPTYNEIHSLTQIKNIENVVSKLRSIDWAFTTDNTCFLTHNLHSYPAKFIPQIPGNIIANLSVPGELILDPFGGCGTTALEAIRLGRRAISVDANAIGTLIGKVKTSNLDQSILLELKAIKNVLKTLLLNLPPIEKLYEENKKYIPSIPNIDKWFPPTSVSELACIRSKILAMENDKAQNIASLALSKIVLPASFQDSETRYSSKPRQISRGESIIRYLESLDDIIIDVKKTQSTIRYGVCNFYTENARHIANNVCRNNSVDLIVTSPPYGNAYDYHLYHRFRLLWLGHDPNSLGKIEIGSHLRHQRESSGFTTYLSEMKDVLCSMYQVLKPGRYAVLVVGDAVYDKILYQGAESLSEVASQIGFETACIIERQIHKSRRSVVAVGRRANTEKLLVLRKPPIPVSLSLIPPPYKMWKYEELLRHREIEAFFGNNIRKKDKGIYIYDVDPYTIDKAKHLVFSHGVGFTKDDIEPTWQAIIENGFSNQISARKDPKYVTHGLHPYKGKFYPQLAKGLINISGIKKGAKILDPFCGSGTTLLEGYLNGYQTFGCDIHPLSIKIANAKIGILEIDPDIVRETVETLITIIKNCDQNILKDKEQFSPNSLDEIERWFPEPVIYKMNWLLRSIRSSSEGTIRDFLEIILSSIIREISQQNPRDLRIRKRNKPIQDADVIGLYLSALKTQYERIEKFWKVRGNCPNKFNRSKVILGNSKELSTFNLLGITDSSVDLILTSPPYATALPYIDTDRLSLLVLFGMTSARRRPVEHMLVGSREINEIARRNLENMIINNSMDLPIGLQNYLIALYKRISNESVGFRRRNMPSLLLRYFIDMDAIIKNCNRILRQGGEAMIVIGDNRIQLNGTYERIETTKFIEEIAIARGLSLIERINISVSTDNSIHTKNAITENIVLRFKKV